MRKLFFGLVCLVTFITCMPFQGYSAGGDEEEIKLYLGRLQAIPISSPQKVAIGNPQVADIANVTKSELTINPKSVGDITANNFTV